MALSPQSRSLRRGIDAMHPSMLRDAPVMTVDNKHVPKYARVAAAVKDQIADGTLRPGQSAPSGAALSRVTGYSTLTCRRALRVLIEDGVLLPGPSRNARPRVAGLQQPAERDLAAAARALSRGLAARRRACGLTQPGLAAVLGLSVTTIGHAETGRLWQSRQFWEHVDAVLGAGGDLLRLHEAYGEATASGAADQPGSAAPPVRPAVPGDTGTQAGTDGAAVSATAEAGPPGAPPTADPGSGGGGEAPPPPPAALGQASPACVMIMWGDGTVTIVRPPGTPLPEAGQDGQAGTPPPGGHPAD